MGKGIQEIKTGAFANCGSLTKIMTYAVIPPKVDGEIFSEAAYTNDTLYVPQNTLAEYQAATCWSQFYNIEEFDPSTTSIGTMKLSDNSQESIIIYDLTGRRVEKTVKGGVYIVNGRKVVIR